MEEEVLDKYKVEDSNRDANGGRGSCEAAKSTGQESGEKTAGQESSPCSENTTCNDSTEGEEMKRQKRMKIMKEMTKKIGSKSRIDAENRWWLHPCEEETMQKWYAWLGEMQRKMRKERWKKCITKG